MRISLSQLGLGGVRPGIDPLRALLLDGIASSRWIGIGFIEIITNWVRKHLI
jgi:hypothetical protein